MMTRSRTQVLKVVFALEKKTHPKSRHGSEDEAQGIGFEPRVGMLSPGQAIKTLLQIAESIGRLSVLSAGDDALTVAEVLRRFSDKRPWGELTSQYFVFQYGVAASYEHCFLQVEEKQPNTAGAWESWVRPFITENGFVQAWASDAEYDRWQNVTDPFEYEVAGRECSHLRKTSNGLPPPLAMQIIDVSSNPGRWVLRDGYVEAVGSKMWLSDLFWARVGRERKFEFQGTYANCFRTLRNGVLELTLPDDNFNSENGANKQDLLRAVLYG